MSAPEKPRRLGRGLEALLGAPAPAAAPASDLLRIPLSQIKPNPFQPRHNFAPDELADLQTSLRTNGLLQPVTVRSAAAGAGYELVAGERRLRAATALGWTDIPALIRELDDKALLTMALVENLQRADLNPVEEAEGYQRLQDTFSLTQQQIADAVGRDRATVANAVRLLALPTSVRRLLSEGKLSAGHGRALLALKEEASIVAMARDAVASGLSVREVERRARESATAPRSAKRSGDASTSSPEVRRIQDQLRKHFQTDVAITLDGPTKGDIRLKFYSNEDLSRILDMLLPDANAE